jgi:hypothetical protein
MKCDNFKYKLNSIVRRIQYVLLGFFPLKNFHSSLLKLHKAYAGGTVNGMFLCAEFNTYNISPFQDDLLAFVKDSYAIFIHL